MKKTINELRYYFLPDEDDPDKIGYNHLGYHKRNWFRDYAKHSREYGVEKAREILAARIKLYNDKDNRILAEDYQESFIADLLSMLNYLGYRDIDGDYDEYYDIGSYHVYISKSGFYNSEGGRNYLRSVYITVNKDKPVLDQFSISITDHNYNKEKDDPIFSRPGDISLDVHKNIFKKYESSMYEILEALVESENYNRRLIPMANVNLRQIASKFSSKSDNSY